MKTIVDKKYFAANYVTRLILKTTLKIIFYYADCSEHQDLLKNCFIIDYFCNIDYTDYTDIQH